jgi:hypothetical protein
VPARSGAKQDEPRESAGAPEDGEEDRRRGSGSGSPSAPYLAGDACRLAEDRREIAPRLVDDVEENQKGDERGGARLFIAGLAWGEG